MTVYEKMCSDKVFAATMLSEALYRVDFETGDYEPHAPADEIEWEGAEPIEEGEVSAKTD